MIAVLPTMKKITISMMEKKLMVRIVKMKMMMMTYFMN